MKTIKKGDEIIFTVTTSPDYNRVKVSLPSAITSSTIQTIIIRVVKIVDTAVAIASETQRP